MSVVFMQLVDGRVGCSNIVNAFRIEEQVVRKGDLILQRQM